MVWLWPIHPGIKVGADRTAQACTSLSLPSKSRRSKKTKHSRSSSTYTIACVKCARFLTQNSGGLESGEPKESATQDLGAKTPGAHVGVQKSAETLSQQAAAAKDASGSNSWLKGWGLAWPGSKANSEAEQSKHDTPKPLGPQPSTRKTQENSEN